MKICRPDEEDKRYNCGNPCQQSVKPPPRHRSPQRKITPTTQLITASTHNTTYIHVRILPTHMRHLHRRSCKRWNSQVERSQASLSIIMSIVKKYIGNPFKVHIQLYKPIQSRLKSGGENASSLQGALHHQMFLAFHRWTQSLNALFNTSSVRCI